MPQFSMADVSVGSTADMAVFVRDVRFTPQSGHRLSALGCALNVASFNSFSGFDHQNGTKPQRIGTSSRLPSRATIVSIVVVGQTL
jgi:hypothetical protein